ncbi:MAG: hypothetical protein U0V75_06395 [Ferruginibacter sp.]
MDAVLWSKADVMFTDAFMRIIKDFKFGRMNADSLSLAADSLQPTDFYSKTLGQLTGQQNFTALMNSVQPS